MNTTKTVAEIVYNENGEVVLYTTHLYNSPEEIKATRAIVRSLQKMLRDRKSEESTHA